MNNLQRLYETNKDFHAFVTTHLVVFEKWYADDLAGTRVDDDLEADKWLMEPIGGEASLVEQARNDLETMKLYASKVRELFVKAYRLADWMWGHVPVKYISVEYVQQMNEIYNAMQELGIEVEKWD